MRQFSHHTHTLIPFVSVEQNHSSVSSHTRRKEDRETSKKRLSDREIGYLCRTLNKMQSILMSPVNIWIHLIQAGIKNLNNSEL